MLDNIFIFFDLSFIWSWTDLKSLKLNPFTGTGVKEYFSKTKKLIAVLYSKFPVTKCVLYIIGEKGYFLMNKVINLIQMQTYVTFVS